MAKMVLNVRDASFKDLMNMIDPETLGDITTGEIAEKFTSYMKVLLDTFYLKKFQYLENKKAGTMTIRLDVTMADPDHIIEAMEAEEPKTE